MTAESFTEPESPAIPFRSRDTVSIRTPAFSRRMSTASIRNTLFLVNTDRRRCYTSSKYCVMWMPFCLCNWLSRSITILPCVARQRSVQHTTHPSTTVVVDAHHCHVEVVKLGCQHVLCLQYRCRYKLSCLHTGEDLRTPIGSGASCPVQSKSW